MYIVSQSQYKIRMILEGIPWVAFKLIYCLDASILLRGDYKQSGGKGGSICG